MSTQEELIAIYGAGWQKLSRRNYTFFLEERRHSLRLQGLGTETTYSLPSIPTWRKDYQTDKGNYLEKSNQQP